jgi:hypothetical protein
MVIRQGDVAGLLLGYLNAVAVRLPVLQHLLHGPGTVGKRKDASMLLSAAAASSAPWWGSGLFTLFGAVLGGVVTQAANVYLNRRKRKDDEETAERSQRREAVTSFVSAAHTYVTKGADPENEAALYSAWVMLQLTLREDLRELAMKYFNAAVSCNKEGNHSPEALNVCLAAQDALLEAARAAYQDLGLPKPL